MTLEELKQCDGFTVQVMLDGNGAIASIETRLSQDGRPRLSWPLAGEWKDELLLPLSENDAASFRINGDGNIYSAIRLSTEGGRHRL